MDAQLGRVLDALEASGEADNTIIVFWGDHGWNLGDHAMWCKHTPFNTSLRVPLIFSSPGHDPGRSPGMVEYVEIFPTLYVHATGAGDRPSDIFASRKERVIPSMRTYFNQMNALHVSYAAFGGKNTDAVEDYVRARRYPVPEGGKFRSTGTFRFGSESSSSERAK